MNMVTNGAVMAAIPAKPGVYAIEFTLPAPRVQRIGCLGEVRFQQGSYIYLGSARGPGGLRARIGRHLDNGRETTHWHVDAFKTIARAVAYCYTYNTGSTPHAKPGLNQFPLECLWSQCLVGLPGVSIPVVGFGASDCRSGCRAHLVYFEDNASNVSVEAPVLSQVEVQQALAESAGVRKTQLIWHTVR